MAKSNVPVSLAEGGGHVRLTGDLAAATAVGNSEHPEELIQVAGYKTVCAVGNFSGVTSDPVLKIHPMTLDGETRVVAGAPTEVTITATDIQIQYTLQGEHFVEIEVVCDSGDAVTIDWLEVKGTLN